MDVWSDHESPDKEVRGDVSHFVNCLMLESIRRFRLTAIVHFWVLPAYSPTARIVRESCTLCQQNTAWARLVAVNPHNFE